MKKVRSWKLLLPLAALAGILLVWWDGQIAPGNLGLAATIELLVLAVIGGLARIEGAWVGAFAFIVINNYVRDVELPGIGGSFNTIIGLIFLVIVIVSPDGLMGLWDRLWRSLGRGGGGGTPETASVTRQAAPEASVP